jgi:hypothetical protein
MKGWLSGLYGHFLWPWPRAYSLLQFWWVGCLVNVIGAPIFVGYGLTHFYGLVSWWVGDVVRRAYRFGGWLFADSAGRSLAGSVTGGEARQNPCSEKEGFTHPPL